MSPVRLLWSTYQFLFLRLIINMVSIIPGYFAIVWGVKFFRRLTGLEGLLIADIMFGYIGLVVFIVYINFTRKFTTHLIRYAQVASATEIIRTGDPNAAGLLYGFRAMFHRFGSVTGMYFADRLMNSAFHKVSAWVMENTDFIPEVFKKGFLVKLLNSVVRTVIFHVDEVVVSHMYRNRDITAWEGIAQGIELYFRSWKTVLKSAFMTALWLKLFSWAFHIFVLGLGVFYLWGSGFQEILTFFITYKIIATLLRSTLLEPYQTMSMLLGFYVTRHDEVSDTTVSDKLQDIAVSLREILRKGKTSDANLADQLAGVVTEGMSKNDEGHKVMSDAGEILSKMLDSSNKTTPVEGGHE